MKLKLTYLVFCMILLSNICNADCHAIYSSMEGKTSPAALFKKVAECENQEALLTPNKVHGKKIFDALMKFNRKHSEIFLQEIAKDEKTVDFLQRNLTKVSLSGKQLQILSTKLKKNCSALFEKAKNNTKLRTEKDLLEARQTSAAVCGKLRKSIEENL